MATSKYFISVEATLIYRFTEYGLVTPYGLGHGGAVVLLPAFAINWYENQETKQPHLHMVSNI